MMRNITNPERTIQWILLAVLVGAAAPAAAKQSVFSLYIRQAEQALEKQQYDSAFSYYALAHLNGMSKDSLLYGWGEVYRVKGVYDTALALNFSIKSREPAAFARMLFRQRYLIYSALSWEQKARDILDSLATIESSRRGRFMPDIQVAAVLGYSSLHETVAGAYPWSEYAAFDTTDIEHGIYSTVQGLLCWNVFSKKKHAFTFDLGCTAEKPYYIQDNVLDSMKVNMLVSARFGVRDLFKRLTMYAQAGGRRSWDGKYSSVDNIDASYVVSDASWVRILSAGYGVELSNESRDGYQSIWLGGYTTNATRRGRGISLSLFANGYFGDDIPYVYSDVAQVIYVDDVNAEFTTHYTDASYTTAVDTAGKTLLQYINDVKYGYTTVVPVSELYGAEIASVIPQSHFSASPSLSYAFTTTPWLKVNAGCGWTLRCYFREYEWVTVDESGFETYTSETSRLAFNHSDGRYYLLEQIQPSYPGWLTGPSHDYSLLVEKYAETPAAFLIESHRQRRIDNAASINLSLEFKTKRMGNFVLAGFFSRTWSTLSADCPIEVSEYSWSAQVQWRKDIPLKNRL